MSSADKTAPSQTSTVTFEFELNHSPKKVWRALTEPALLSEWLLPVVGFSLEPNARFQFRTQAQPGWDGTVDCRMIEVEPQHKLRYAWGVPGLDTVVTFTLTPTPTGTRLVVEQSGFREDQKQNFGGARYGWRLMGTKLVELLDRVE